MILYLMRHGQTRLNREGRLQGQIDTELDAEGIAEAERAGNFVRKQGLVFDRVYSSHLSRAVDTAVLVSGWEREKIRIDDRILEMDYGASDGARFQDLAAPVRNFLLDPVHAPLPEGFESLSHLEERTGSFLRDLAEEAGKREKQGAHEERILAVTHGVAIRAMLRRLDGIDEERIWKVRIDNCDLRRTICRGGVYSGTESVYRGAEAETKKGKDQQSRNGSTEI
ncbi:MAG: histidine phosphatase family protein [Lachnospiraceae bacterium]